MFRRWLSSSILPLPAFDRQSLMPARGTRELPASWALQSSSLQDLLTFVILQSRLYLGVPARLRHLGHSRGRPACLCRSTISTRSRYTVPHAEQVA